MNLKVHGIVEYRDIHNFILYTNLSKRLYNNIFTLTLVFFVIFILDKDSGYSWIELIGAYIIYMFSALILIWKLYIPYVTKKLIKETNDIIGEKSYLFDDIHMQYESPLSNGSVVWEKFVGFSEKKDQFILWINNHSGFFIPKKFFSSDQEIDKFKDFLEKKIVSV